MEDSTNWPLWVCEHCGRRGRSRPNTVIRCPYESSAFALLEPLVWEGDYA